MKWLDAAERMENYVIKKDSTSTNSDYFMATHVPFQNLEFISSGDTGLAPKLLSEEQIYHSYFVEHPAHHQMIMVRGTNGTGKSHLICWLHNRLVNDRDNYDPKKEEVIFLRRLRNTSRGAIQQMLDTGLVQDPELQEKFSKFVSASLSQDQSEFKSTIYHAYITKVFSDKSKEYYKPIKCKDIASFLSDSRVQEYFLSETGPITRCYRTITSGVNPNDGTTKATFEASDFKFPRELVRRIKADAAKEVSGFYLEELSDDPKAMAALAAYLNHFTSAVIQNCANITSENIRELFENLRRNLKKEGKRLTVLIEDFTSFSIVDSELITALAVEPGGEYHDLCPATSVIGITDGHYDSFRDNFKDRVFNQINVTERSFSEESFITEMAARYLNAIYCEEEQIRAWYEQGAVQNALPTASFRPNFEWDSVTIDEHVFTLYPFTKKSLITLFRNLKERKPRHFLDAVIRQLFRQFASGMDDNCWDFPDLPPNIASIPMNITYASSVEQSQLQDADKRRLKTLLAVWGDGTSKADDRSIGNVPKEFLAEIGLKSFSGLQQFSSASGQDAHKDDERDKPQRATEHMDAPQPKALSSEEISYHNFMEDIQSWFENGTPLRYDDDYFKWITTFILNGISWQDEGVPAYYVTQRQRNGGFVMIEGSEKAIRPESAVIYLEKSSETRNILAGLAAYDRYSSWNFEDASYYQYILVSWLEKHKTQIKQNIHGDCVGYSEQPAITWCLALEYLQRLLHGESLDESSNDKFLQQIFSSNGVFSSYEPRENTLWNDVVTGIHNSQSVYTQSKGYLLNSANTSMGVVGDPMQQSAKIYRYSELINSLEHLRKKGWDISDELEQTGHTKQFTSIVRQLKDLYEKIRKVVVQENALAQKTLDEFTAVLGEEVTEDNLISLSEEITRFYAQCNRSNQPYREDLKTRMDEDPLNFAKRIRSAYQSVQTAVNTTSQVELLQVFSKDPIKELTLITSDLNALAYLADLAKKQHQRLTGIQTPVNTKLAELAKEKLTAVLDDIEGWGSTE